jgi:hypothetical protein
MNRLLEREFRNKRRTILQGALGALGAASFLGMTAHEANAAKVSMSAAGYKDSPNGDQKCANCRTFTPPNACRRVEGNISPNGWCRIWAKSSG